MLDHNRQRQAKGGKAPIGTEKSTPKRTKEKGNETFYEGNGSRRREPHQTEKVKDPPLGQQHDIIPNYLIRKRSASNRGTIDRKESQNGLDF